MSNDDNNRWDTDDIDTGEVFIYKNETPDFRKPTLKDRLFSLKDRSGMSPVIAVCGAVVLLALGSIVGYGLGHSSAIGNGYDIGYEQGYDEGNDAGYNDGLDMGKEEGYKKGYDDGIEAGKNDAYYGIVNDVPVGDATTSAATGGGDTVYATAGGSCYHKAECSHVAGKSNLRTFTVAEAKEQGLRPCSVCGP